MRVLPVNSAADRVSSAQNLPHGAESGDGKRNLPRAVKLQHNRKPPTDPKIAPARTLRKTEPGTANVCLNK